MDAKATPEMIGWGGALLGVVYYLWRTIVGDKRSDRAAKAAEEFRDELAKRTKELEDRADKFAGERNELVHKVAALEAGSATKDRLVKQLTAERDEAVSEVAIEKAVISKLRDEKRDLMIKLASCRWLGEDGICSKEGRPC